MTYGAVDELVPFTGGVEQVEAFNNLGYRYYAVLYPAEDHLVFATAERLRPGHLAARAPGKGAQPGLVHVHLVPGPGLAVARDRPDRRLLGQRPVGAQRDTGRAGDGDGKLSSDP